MKIYAVMDLDAVNLFMHNITMMKCLLRLLQFLVIIFKNIMEYIGLHWIGLTTHLILSESIIYMIAISIYIIQNMGILNSGAFLKEMIDQKMTIVDLWVVSLMKELTFLNQIRLIILFH